MRLVFDTNIVMSGLLWRGTPHQLFILAKENRALQLVTSLPLLDELADVITRKQFTKRLALIEKSSAQILADYLQVVELVEPVSIPPTSSDPDDDAVLACALAAQADFVVSGDDNLLVLREFAGIPLVTAAVALQRITLQT
ncbi:MAG: putative toxin-antitoxin system toxin component, PIN family [Burkholderiaceae bacterium]|nr:putative toxin-antitoxin system toxin component, PIN family [Burkholderiaceae bacterium]